MCGFKIKLDNKIIKALVEKDFTIKYFDRPLHVSDHIHISANNLLPLSTWNTFIHIPKTAGTTLRHLLQEQEVVIQPSLSDIKTNSGHYIRFQDLHNNLMSTSPLPSHLIFGHYPYSRFLTDKYLNYEFSTILRDPIERALSNLIHLKSYNVNCLELSLSEIIDFAPYQVDNAIVRYLCSDTLTMNDTVQESHLYQALENIRKFKVVGIQEYFGEFCLQYFNYLNIDFDIQKTKKHVNKRVNNFSGREVKEAT